MAALRSAVLALTLAACERAPTSTATPNVSARCSGAPQVGPATATVHPAESVTFAVSLEMGCPEPLIRNETPGILQLDAVSPTLIRVTGRAAGDGRMRVRSGPDTLASTVIPVTVQP
jgi:hypothetical protein